MTLRPRADEEDDYKDGFDYLAGHGKGDYAFFEVNWSNQEKARIASRRKRRVPLGFQLPPDDEAEGVRDGR